MFNFNDGKELMFDQGYDKANWIEHGKYFIVPMLVPFCLCPIIFRYRLSIDQSETWFENLGLALNEQISEQTKFWLLSLKTLVLFIQSYAKIVQARGEGQ